MGTGYTRNDTANNIADGNIINAADFDGEYDAIEAAFNSSSGHTHDGTSGEGAPVTVLGPAQDFVASTTEIKPKTNNTLDIGTSLLKFKDAHLAGTANLVNLTTTGDVTLTGAANNVVFDASDNALEFADSAKATFGDAADLQIFHDASNSIVRDSGTGILALDGSTVEIRKNDGTKTMAQFVEDGAVSLYHDNSVKLATTATGVTVTGSLAMDGLSLGDNEKVQLGTGTDLELYHDGTDSIIENNTGELFIQGDNVTLRSDTGTETFIAMDVNGAVELYHNNVKKFDTDADGVNVTGQVDVSTNVNITGDLDVGDDVTLSSDGAIINFGAAPTDVTLTHVADTGLVLNVENSTTNAVTDLLKLQVQSSGTPAVGIGTGIEFSTETAAGNLEIGGVIESSASGLTPTSEEFDMLFKTMSSGGAAAERLKLNGSGATIGNINVNGNTIISTDTDGNIALTPNGTGEVDITKVDIDSGAIDAVTLGTNSAVTELQVDNINVNGNAITSTDTDGNIALTPNGTGEVDISKVDIAAGEIDGTTIGANSAAAGTFTNLTASTNLTLASGATVTAILDEDNMATDSATALATQQSIKAYIATQVGAASNITDTGITFEGSSADDHETVFAITNPTADRTFTFADESGTVSTRSFAEESATALAIALG